MWLCIHSVLLSILALTLHSNNFGLKWSISGFIFGYTKSGFGYIVSNFSSFVLVFWDFKEKMGGFWVGHGDFFSSGEGFFLGCVFGV